MNESSPNPHNSLLLKQHYLFTKDGSIGVGYFPYRDNMIVVLFDGSHSNSFEDIKNFSNTRIVSEDFARRDWNARVENETTPFVNCVILSEKEVRIRAILFGLAVRCRDYEEARIAEIEEENNETTSVWYQKWKKHLIAHTESQEINYEDNTQYALEA